MISCCGAHGLRITQSGQPLDTKEIFSDISSDHAKKTVTIDSHPHLGIPFAYIHPCRHAEVMKKLMQRMKDAGKELRVDQYVKESRECDANYVAALLFQCSR